MIRMTWRQFRLQALVGAVLLAVAVAGLVFVGLDVRNAYDGYRARCSGAGDCAETMSQFLSEYQNLILILGGLLMLVPAIIGMFWGAPLVARELEAGTHRLVWNQSVPRRRWLAVKILVVGLVAVVVAGTLGGLLTWAAGPVDQVAGNRFSTPVFGARDIVPIGSAAFAFVLGTIIGMLVRRTVPAMALTLLVVIAGQFLVPNLVRPHLMPPQTLTRAMTADAINELDRLGGLGSGAAFGGLKVPDAWVTDTSPFRTPDGRSLDDNAWNECWKPRPPAPGRFGGVADCLGELDLHVEVAYQPNDRYWPFQWLEFSLYVLLSALLVGLGRWRIQYRT